MPENSILTKTEIVIRDYNNNGPIVFSNLSLSESLINVNNFSFSVRPIEPGSGFSAILDFKKQVLGKSVQLDFKDGDGNTNHKFNGIILEVNSSIVDDQYYEFHITGSGDFCKVNEIAECHSFYKKTLNDIIGKAFEKSSLKDKIKKDPQTSKQLHYIVQYNQSLFSFMSYLAIRFGEWMFYDGESLQFGKKPEGDAIELQSPGDVSNLNIRAHVIKKPESAIGTDIFRSELIESKSKEQAPDNDFIKAVDESGDSVFENPGGSIFMASGFNQAFSDDKYKLEQQAIYSSSVFITGTTRNNKVRIGKKIKIKDASDDAGRTYIITQIQHNASNYSNYSNSFTAIPMEAQVPPYTNPILSPKATPQPAIITDNEDDGGLARVKVKFPWMADDEKTPWISVLTPHAGKDKGFRFIPEIDDEVMVDFWDANAETPFVTGSVYTEKNKSGIAETGNHVKMIGSRSGRRFHIDDDKKKLQLTDSPYQKEYPGNYIVMSGEEEMIDIGHAKSKDDFAKFTAMSNGVIGLVSKIGGTQKYFIKFDPDSNCITIESKGDIKIKADQKIDINAMEINMKATNIKITADSSLEMKGTSEAKLEGTQVKINADATLEAKGGATAKVEGSAMLELKSGAMAKLEGAIVMIN